MADKNSDFPSHKYIIFENILKYKTSILNCNNITVFTVSNKYSVVSIRNFFIKHKQILLTSNFSVCNWDGLITVFHYGYAWTGSNVAESWKSIYSYSNTTQHVCRMLPESERKRAQSPKKRAKKRDKAIVTIFFYSFLDHGTKNWIWDIQTDQSADCSFPHCTKSVTISTLSICTHLSL